MYLQSLVPQDQLLVYKVGDGWRSLCEFLGHDVPDRAFPHENRARTDDTIAGKYVKFSVFSRGSRGVKISVMKILAVISLLLWLYSLTRNTFD